MPRGGGPPPSLTRAESEHRAGPTASLGPGLSLELRVRGKPGCPLGPRHPGPGAPDDSAAAAATSDSAASSLRVTDDHDDPG